MKSMVSSRKRKRSLPLPLPVLRPCKQPAKIGNTVDIFPLLGDFLISNPYRNNNNAHRRRYRVRVDDIRGKTILIYMHPLRGNNILHGLSRYTQSLIATLKERDFDFEFEVVLVPVNREHAFSPNYAMNLFLDLYFAKMPWLAVPFANKRACDLIQDTFCSRPWVGIDPFWALIDPSGKVLLTSDYRSAINLSVYGIGELVPLMLKMLPSLGDAGKTACVNNLLWFMSMEDDSAVSNGIINLNKILTSPCSDFLLTKDGNKVPISILKDKVVGIYFCNHAVRYRPRMEIIKKTYKEIARLGYDFEIVQINFCFYSYFLENISCREDVPWLTLPCTQSHCKRLIRIFKGHTLVIINPHECNNMKDNSFYERRGMDIIHHFGIEAYPFNRRRVFEMVSERRSEEIKLRLIFGHIPLLRRGGGGSYDLVSVSQLWGKRVLLIFATHSKYDPRKFMASLKSKYVEQKGVDVFEVVYVSFDTNVSTFDDFTADMPWLVHPYSWEFARTWVSKICDYYDVNMEADTGNDNDNDNDNDNYSDSDSDSSNNSDSDSDSSESEKGAWCGMANFDEDGELVSTKCDSGSFVLEKDDYPFIHSESEDIRSLWDLKYKYGINMLDDY